jgi:outer membrane protein assembly factor BamB
VNAENQRYAVAGVDLRDGGVMWRRSVGQRIWAIAVGKETVVAGTAVPMDSTAELKGSIQAFDRRDGRERWRLPTERPIASLALVDDTVFASTVRGGLLALR